MNVKIKYNDSRRYDHDDLMRYTSWNYNQSESYDLKFNSIHIDSEIKEVEYKGETVQVRMTSEKVIVNNKIKKVAYLLGSNKKIFVYCDEFKK
jgi:hypothetical protein